MYGKPSAKPRTIRRRSTGYKKSTYRRRPVPSRFNNNRKRYTKSKQLSSFINNVAETKLIPCIQQDERNPAPVQTGAQATFLSFNTGLNASFTSSVPIDGILLGQGTGFNQRTGNYVYYKKMHGVIRTEMNAGTNDPPIQFRTIICKLRRQNTPEGVTPSAATSLFLDNAGEPFGHETGGKNGLDLMMQMTNKRQWVIYKDVKYILQPYNDFNPTGTGLNIIYNHYPASKEMQFNLPFYKKAYMTQSNLPEDMAYRYIMVTYGHTLGRSGIVASSFEQSFRGTTSFADV